MDKWLSNPTSLKIIAVLIAIIIWAVVHIDPETSPQSVTSNTDTKIIEAAPIVAVGLDRDRYVLSAMEPTVVRLVVEGRISSLKTATNDDYVVELDLSGVGPGIQDLPLTVKMPKGITEVEISPRYVTVQIEELETQTLEVQVLTEGEPAAGYLVGESSIVGTTGNVVEVTMPTDDFARLDKLAVTVDITGADTTVINKKAKIVAYDTLGTPIDNVTVNPDTLTAQTIITLPEKEVPIQLRYTGTLPEGYSLVSISTSQEMVKVHALQQVLDSINLYDGFVVDLSNVDETGEIQLKANLLEGVKEVSPAEIPVNIVIEKIGTRVMSAVPIQVNGLNDQYDLAFTGLVNNRMDVQLQGAESLLQKVKASDVILSVDVTDLPPGTHQLTVAAELPAYIQASVTGDYTLDVTVTIIDKKELEAITDPEPTDEPTGSDPPPPDGGNEEPSSGSNNGANEL